ncbi:MAG TPA: hypothetical protein VNW94_29755 [Streptosporangiaceae bacterium]|nr:hypothetical protein [Streptosporangiaceae bacterium]
MLIAQGEDAPTGEDLQWLISACREVLGPAHPHTLEAEALGG